MPDISAVLPNKTSNRRREPGHFHTQCSTDEPEDKSSDSSPAKWQEFPACPRIPFVVLPTRAAEDYVFFDNNDDVNNSPVSNNGQKSLESILEEGRCTATHCDGGDETESDKGDPWNAKSPWPKVLSMHCERIVIGNIVLSRLET